MWWSVSECCSVAIVLVIRCQTLLEDLWIIWSCCLYVFYEYYYHIPSYSLGSVFFINVYMVLFLFDNVTYVFLLLWLCILTVCLCPTTLIEVFPCFFLSYKANSRVKPANTGHSPHSFSFLCCSMFFFVTFYYFCVVLCIVCFVSFSELFVCICVLNYCHRVATQLQLNIAYHIRIQKLSYNDWCKNLFWDQTKLWKFRLWNPCVMKIWLMKLQISI